jgi:magnesium-transporting ATPase (P-type)
LTYTEAAVRLQHYGRDTIATGATTPLFRKFLSHFTHLMALLLWGGGLLGFLTQMPQLGLAVWLVNLINGAFSFWQEYKAEQAPAALQRLLPTYARVLRDGQEQRLLAEELVPGDVILLAEGDHISADGRLVQAADLRVVARKGGIDLEAEAQQPRLCELPFDSRRKRMSTIHQSHDSPHATPIAYVKGAPQEVLALCTHHLLHGQVYPLEDTYRTQIMAANDAAARRGLRVLAVAQRTLPARVTLYTPETIEAELTFLGLIAMLDPPRPEVAEAVEKCHRAGVRIMMITGDYGLTAESIARRIGIIRGPQPRLLTGPELATMDDEALKAALQDEVICARMTPEQKLRVVTALRELGHVVAVTGDGVNDAPALKQADIGVAMGRTGTDVAKEAADMILTDDNFASIVNAVEEGRAVYANIRKFVVYIFTSNTPEAVPFVLFTLSGGRILLALTVMQILSIDLGTDLVPALALGAEPPEPGVMERPPRRLSEHVITRALLLRAYAWLGSIQSLAAMSAFYCMYWTNGYWGQWLDLPAGGLLYRAATAMTLAAVVVTQIGNLFAQRTVSMSVFQMRWDRNRLVWVGIATELLLLLSLLYVPVLQRLFDTAPFPPQNWLFLCVWAPLLLMADEGRKALVRRRARVT